MSQSVSQSVIDWVSERVSEEKGDLERCYASNLKRMYKHVVVLIILQAV